MLCLGTSCLLQLISKNSKGQCCNKIMGQINSQETVMKFPATSLKLQ